MMIPLYNHISTFFIRSKPSGAGLIGIGGIRSSINEAARMRLHALTALFRRHSSEAVIVPNQIGKPIFHRSTSFPHTKKTGEPHGAPRKKRDSSENSCGHDEAHAHLTAHVATHHALEAHTKHGFPPQNTFPYVVDMFISQSNPFVNRKMKAPVLSVSFIRPGKKMGFCHPCTK